MNYLVYPLKIMNITQGYVGSFSHELHTQGDLKDYPIDDNCGDSKKNGYFYCPCDEMIVKKISGLGMSNANSLYLESTSKVITPTFNDFVTIKITHPNDESFKDIYVGKKYKRWDKIILEGNDGLATGNHFHISVGRGKLKGTGVIKNSKGAYVINTTKKGVKPEAAFFIDSSFTKIKNTKGIKFQKLIEDNIYYLTTSLNVRVGPSVNYKNINTLPANTMVYVYEEKNNFARISDLEWISANFLTKGVPSKVYKCKKVTADALNVREKPNGKKVDKLTPVTKNTTVAVMEEKKGFTKINKNRWVSSKYIK